MTFVEADLPEFHFLVNPAAGTCECLWAGAVTGTRNCSLWLLSYKVPDWDRACIAPEEFTALLRKLGLR